MNIRRDAPRIREKWVWWLFAHLQICTRYSLATQRSVTGSMRVWQEKCSMDLASSFCEMGSQVSFFLTILNYYSQFSCDICMCFRFRCKEDRREHCHHGPSRYYFYSFSFGLLIFSFAVMLAQRREKAWRGFRWRSFGYSSHSIHFSSVY